MARERKCLPAYICFLLMGAALITVFLLNVGLGSADIEIKTIADIILGKTAGNDTFTLIIKKVRLPRAYATIVGGAAISVSGLLLQTFFMNPIVEPYILGVTSGSSLFIALVFLGGFTMGMPYVTPYMLFAGSFTGAMLVMCFIMFTAKKTKNILTLLIVGMMAGYICSSATSILAAFAEREAIANFSMWTMGSFAGFTMGNVEILFLLVAPFLFLSFLLSKQLNALGMGERYAESMGVNVRRIRYLIILFSSVLTAAVTAFAGPVSFIGLAVPHICRIIFYTSDAKILIPASVLGGGLMLGFCDLVARNIMSPVELPLGAITALIGAPVVVYLLASRSEKQ